MSRRLRRRTLLIATSAAALGGAYAVRPADRGGPHNPYFAALSRALKRAGIAQPVLVIDRRRLQHNIDAVRTTLAPSGLSLRLVVKSLPATALLEAIAEPLGVTRYMVFNGPMLHELARKGAAADLLLGKPLPVQAAEHFYIVQRAAAQPPADPQWLIDTHERLQQYRGLARRLGRSLRINFEIDVGLHRGGFTSPTELARAVELAGPECTVTGLMGYDAHVPQMPSTASAYQDSQECYRRCADVLRSKRPATALTLNAAGSPTYQLHTQHTVANEVSIGSAFLKPADFDLSTLQHHVPAVFIATPVLKALPRTEIPGLEPLTGLRRLIDVNTAQAFFIYGGHWLARPESPPGLQWSDLYGRSSNQELLMGSASIDLKPDDFIYFRPTQSEAVLLQFGPLCLFDGEQITARWQPFVVSA